MLDHDLTVTGEHHRGRYLSSIVLTLIYSLRMTDVDKSRTSIKLADDVMDIKYRNSFEKKRFMEPDGIYEVRIRT